MCQTLICQEPVGDMAIQGGRRPFQRLMTSAIVGSLLVFAKLIMLKSLRRSVASRLFIKPVWSILISFGRSLFSLLVKALETILKSALSRLIGP